MEAIITQAATEDQIAAIRELIREYTAWAFTLAEGSDKAPTFQGLDAELAALPGVYSPPAGRLLLATLEGQPAGCVCFKGHDASTCELKRLYVRPTMRGLNLGWKLVSTLVEEARRSGYRRMVLDSHMSMKKAHELYRAAGFKDVSAPSDFPEELKPIVVFMELDLASNR
jgi:GNAT superfamily N-acetyltransferase